jgi:hypothetical protein
MSQLSWALLLISIYQVKHFLCDFPLQSQYMLRKVAGDWGFVIPLAYHCSVHASFTLMFCVFINPKLWWLAILDFVIHFVMDRIKAGPNYLGRFNDYSKAGFWNALGFDQMIHHLTHYFIVWVLVTQTPLGY